MSKIYPRNPRSTCLGGGVKNPCFLPPLKIFVGRFQMELGPQIFFWKNLCNFWAHPKKFSATPLRPPPFPATQISEICDFWPKIAFFWLLRAHRVPKWGPHPQNFFANTFGCFWCGPIFFGHPAPTTHISGHRNFCIWPFLGENCHFGGNFALNYPTKGLKSQKKIFVKIFFESWDFRKKSQKWPERGISTHRPPQSFFFKIP